MFQEAHIFITGKTSNPVRALTCSLLLGKETMCWHLCLCVCRFVSCGRDLRCSKHIDVSMFVGFRMTGVAV